MKNFLFILIAFIASLTIQAQAYQLDNLNYSNICVVQQHIDIGVTIQPFDYSNIYISPTSFPTATYYVSESNFCMPVYAVVTSNPIIYTSYTEQYRRGVGLINNNVINRNIYIQTTNLVTDVDYSQNNYQNVQKYYCK